MFHESPPCAASSVLLIAVLPAGGAWRPRQLNPPFIHIKISFCLVDICILDNVIISTFRLFTVIYFKQCWGKRDSLVKTVITVACDWSFLNSDEKSNSTCYNQSIVVDSDWSLSYLRLEPRSETLLYSHRPSSGFFLDVRKVREISRKPRVSFRQRTDPPSARHDTRARASDNLL